jgi:hypothetical protein
VLVGITRLHGALSRGADQDHALDRLLDLDEGGHVPKLIGGSAPEKSLVTP